MKRTFLARAEAVLGRQMNRLGRHESYLSLPPNADSFEVWSIVKGKLPETITPIPDEHLVAFPMTAGEPIPGITFVGDFGAGSWLFRDRRYLDMFKVKILRAPAVRAERADAIIVLGGSGLSEGSATTTNIRVLGQGSLVALGYVRRFPSEIIVGHGASLVVGDLTSTAGIDIRVTKGSVSIGRDCQIGAFTKIRAMHHHGIVDLSADEPRIMPKTRQIKVGNHVWLGEESRLIGNATIGDGSVLGAFSVLGGKIPANCIAVGNPARVVRENRTWSRAESVIDDDSHDYIESYAKSLSGGGSSQISS